MIRTIFRISVLVSLVLVPAYSRAVAQIGLGVAEINPVSNVQRSQSSDNPSRLQTFREKLQSSDLPPGAKIEFDRPLSQSDLKKLSTQYTISNVNYDPDTCHFTVTAIPLAHGQTLRLNGCASVAKRVPVITKAIQTGDVISAPTIRWENRDLPQHSFNLIRWDDIDGAIARRNLPAGSIIGRQDIEFPTLIERGASVSLIYVKHGLRISSRGIAVESAKLGDLVAVRIGEERRTIKARVTGQDEAIVQ